MMDWKQYVRAHLPALRLRPERESSIVEELASQLEQAYRDALRAGEPEAAAEQHAKSQFGDWEALGRAIEATEPTARRPFSGISGDVRHAFRALRGNPSFSLVAIATLALGIGGCTTIFSLIQAVILQPIGYREPEQLVMVWENNPKHALHKNSVAMADYLDWKARSHVFDRLCLIFDQIWNFTRRGEPQELKGISVSADFLAMLGEQPLLGRSFLPGEARAGGPHIALISHKLWVERFGASRSAIGQAITLDDISYTIVGVLPARFPWLGTPLDVLTPAQFPNRDWRHKAGRFLRVAGRLKAGVSIADAQTEMSAIARQLEAEYPEFNRDWGVELVPMAEHFAGGSQTALWILMAAVGLVLLIACANVANLLLARAAVREREIAIRTALGASAGLLLRLLSIESLTLAIAGGALGVAGAHFAIRAIQVYGPQDLTRLQSAGLNAPVVIFSVLTSLLTVALFGIAPAFAALRLNPAATLKEGGRSIMQDRRGNRLRGAFVVSEIALALILLTAASLLFESLVHLSTVPTGFDPHNVLTASISVSGHIENAKLAAQCRDIVDRIGQLPGVERAGFITFLPFAGLGAATDFAVAGRPPDPPGQGHATDVRVVQPGYFEAMRIPLLAGRLFTAADNASGAPLTIVVNQKLVKDMFGAGDPIGQRLIVDMGDNRPLQIIGVVGDTKTVALDGAIYPMVYYPQIELPISYGSFVVRTKGQPESMARAVVAAIQSLRPDQPVYDVKTMEQWIGDSFARQRFQTALLGAFAIIAVLLAMTGVYGVMTYSVEQRTHEMGVKLALGADPAALKHQVTAQGMRLAAIGLGIGLAGAAASTRVLKSLLFEIAPRDPFTFAATALLLAAVCLAASYVPARRATRVDPLVALRWE